MGFSPFVFEGHKESRHFFIIGYFLIVFGILWDWIRAYRSIHSEEDRYGLLEPNAQAPQKAP